MNKKVEVQRVKVGETTYRGKPLDLFQKQLVVVEENHEVYLTEEHLNYMPTQDDLKKYRFFASKELAEKLFLPFYCLRTVKKDKVVASELVLEVL